MKKILKLISTIGLILTLIPSLFVFTDSIEPGTHRNLMFLGTMLWFISAPFWMKKDAGQGQE